MTKEKRVLVGFHYLMLKRFKDLRFRTTPTTKMASSLKSGFCASAINEAAINSSLQKQRVFRILLLCRLFEDS